MFFLGMMVMSWSLVAQNYPTPEFMNQPYLFENGKLTALEKQMVGSTSRVKGLGYAGGEGLMTLNQPHSAIRFDESASYEFVVRMETEGKDIFGKVVLLRFNIRKGKREAVVAKVNAIGEASSQVEALPMDIKKLSGNRFLLKVSSLEAGEYGFVVDQMAYAFGVGNIEEVKKTAVIEDFDWKGKFQINLGGGSNLLNSAFFINGQYNFSPKMSAGLTLMSGSDGDVWLPSPFSYFGGRFNYRITEMLNLGSEKYDVTVGANVGRYSVEDEDVSMMFGIHGSGYWYFSKHFGVGMEISLGGPTAMNFILTSRF